MSRYPPGIRRGEEYRGTRNIIDIPKTRSKRMLLHQVIEPGFQRWTGIFLLCRLGERADDCRPCEPWRKGIDVAGECQSVSGQASMTLSKNGVLVSRTFYRCRTPRRQFESAKIGGLATLIRLQTLPHFGRGVAPD